jgi:hypothetical protein
MTMFKMAGDWPMAKEMLSRIMGDFLLSSKGGSSQFNNRLSSGPVEPPKTVARPALSSTFDF